ncbi:MAG: amino acid ABC transporter permease [Ilumatobacteraceae bacterium]
MSETAVTSTPESRPPEEQRHSAGRWVKENLFSSISNSIQTVVFSAIILGLMRWILGQVFAEEADWTSVATNLRLLMSYNYPTDQFVRIWVSAAIVFLMIGLSLGAWRIDPGVSVRGAARTLISTGVLSLIIWLLLPEAAPGGISTALVIVGVGLLIVGAIVMQAVPHSRDRRLGFSTVLAVAVGVALAVIWLVPFGDYGVADGERYGTPGVSVASSTKVPWTIVLLGVLAFQAVGRALAPSVGAAVRRAIVAFWVVGPAFIIFLVLRDPAFDWAHVWSTDIPMAAAFALGGAGLLYVLGKPGREDLARAVGAMLVVFALFNWVAAFFGWYPMLQKARISFLLIALAVLLVPTFAGERAARIRFAAGWAGLMVVMHWLITGMNTESTLVIAAPPFLGGFVLTVGIAYYVMLVSFPLGVLLSLARTSKMPIFRVMSTTYIEVIRGVPLITVLFFFSIMLPLFLPKGMGISDLAAVFAGYTVFSAAYMAENIRGGLQSVRRGQYEAADALGLTTVQRTTLIVLPQALRVSIPNLVGQAIATFKETSLIAIVGGFDLLRIANSTIPNQPDFLGQKRPGLLFISVVYFVIAYTMSKSSQRLEARLQAGQAK